MFNPHLAVGQILTEKEVNNIFKCQINKGIRMNTSDNLIVLMSGSAKKKSYDDEWKGDILYYIGTDANHDSQGNQTLNPANGNNNKQLRDVWFENPFSQKALYLFVKKETNKCIYKGRVELIMKPYQKWRDDSMTSKVWVFPVKLMKIDEAENTDSFEAAEANALKNDLKNLYDSAKGKEDRRLPGGTAKYHSSNSIIFDRNPVVSAYAKKRAAGKCDLCACPAPFITILSDPYLEAHHLVWLSKGGADEIDNVVALCPNCHRKMHNLDSSDDIESLRKKVDSYKEFEKNLGQ